MAGPMTLPLWAWLRVAAAVLAVGGLLGCSDSASNGSGTGEDTPGDGAVGDSAAGEAGEDVPGDSAAGDVPDDALADADGPLPGSLQLSAGQLGGSAGTSRSASFSLTGALRPTTGRSTSTRWQLWGSP